MSGDPLARNAASCSGLAAGSRTAALPPALVAAPRVPQLHGLLVELLDRQADGQALYEPEYTPDGGVSALRGLYMNPVGLALRGLLKTDVIGMDLLARTLGHGNDEAAAAYAAVVTTGEPMHRRVVVDGQSGGRRAYEISGARVPTGASGAPWLLSLTFRDITHELDGRRRLQQTAADLNLLASTDPLTGLLNRRGWEPAFARAVVNAGRADPREPLCVAIADLDRFKAYNDEHGHLAGDDLLRIMANRWRASASPDHQLARLGGEEFAFLFPGQDMKGARTVLNGMRRLVPGGQTVSVGLTLWQPDELAEATLGRADAALFAAKRGGRDRIVALAHA